ncbi:MAG: hypothetical protein ACKOEW_05265, partial [Methylocystis sp.]
MKRMALLFCFMLGMSWAAQAQHLYDIDLYDFLDELANSRAISLNTAVKPYTRELVESKLREATGHRDLLNARQQRQLDNYCFRYHVSSPDDRDTTFRLVSGNRSGSRLDWVYYSYTDSLFYGELTPAVGYTYY